MNVEDPLDHLLSMLGAPAEPPPDFRQEIWRRIALETPPSRASYAAWWLLQPRRAFLTAVAVTALAAAWGLTHPADDDLSPHDAYVVSISPFDLPTSQP